MDEYHIACGSKVLRFQMFVGHAFARSGERMTDEQKS